MTTASPQDTGNDSADLQALFDSLTDSHTTAASPPPFDVKATTEPSSSTTSDSDELQALFDSIAAGEAKSTIIAGTGKGNTHSPTDGDAENSMFNRLGHLTRQLHESLRGLGADKCLEESARQIPDVRQRLSYIAQMTEQAASRVLNATDIAMPLQDKMLAETQGLAQRWEKAFANQLSVDEFKALATDTRTHFSDTPQKLQQTNEQLMEIMMAQDFQDLTGQVIKKVVELVQNLETQLLGLLIEAMPEQRKAETSDGLLNGPVINAEGRLDVVTDQAQVDDLLESLGF
ncbi:MAG: protein phosphatase CheZ [Rugosibacter sp.]|jgi:chemotaxis protein CheZ